MRRSSLGGAALFVVLVLGTATPARAADDYTIDAMHAGVNFKISHLGLSWTFGRFNEFSGTFSIDRENPAKSSLALTINPQSVDTANTKRDDHLRSPDFFNVKQFPVISFKSTAIKRIEGGLQVTGDFTLHGVTKSVTFPIYGGKSAEFPKGVVRTGYTTELTIKRSDFGMDKMREGVGDEVMISISFEGVKK